MEDQVLFFQLGLWIIVSILITFLMVSCLRCFHRQRPYDSDHVPPTGGRVSPESGHPVLIKRLKEENLGEILTHVWNAREHWEKIGIDLGLQKNDLNVIKGDSNNKIDECFREMIYLWLKQENPTWQDMISALKNAEYHGLAAQIFEHLTQASVYDEESTTGGKICKLVKHDKVTWHSDADNQFPFLDIPENMCEIDREALKFKLCQDTEQIMREFYYLLIKMQNSLKDSRYTPQDIANTVWSIANSDASNRQLRTSIDIDNTDSIERFLRQLQEEKYVTFINYDIVEFLIQCYGSDQDKDRLRAYLERFKEYCRRSVFEVPQSAYGMSTNRKKLICKVTKEVMDNIPSHHVPEDVACESLKASSKNFDNLSLGSVKIVQYKVAKTLNLNPATLVLENASKGCIQLIFSMSEAVKDNIKEQSLISRESFATRLSNLKVEGIHLLYAPPSKPYPVLHRNGWITLYWNKPEYLGIQSVQHYQIHYRPVDDPPNKWKTLITEDEKLVISPDMLDVSHQNITAFVFKIEAVSDIGSIEGDESDPVSIKLTSAVEDVETPESQKSDKVTDIDTKLDTGPGVHYSVKTTEFDPPEAVTMRSVKEDRHTPLMLEESHDSKDESEITTIGYEHRAQRPSLKEAWNALKRIVRWEEIAVELGFESSDIETIQQYPIDQRKLKMVIKWLDNDADASMEKLYDAMENSKSGAGEGLDREHASMIETNETKIKNSFSVLLTTLRNALTRRQAELNADEVHAYLMTICPAAVPKASLDDMFKFVTFNKGWNYQHYHPLEMFVNRFIPDERKEMISYKDAVTGYFLSTKLIHFMQNSDIDSKAMEGSNEVKLSTEQYKNLRIKLKLSRKITDLSLQYVCELWQKIAKEFEIPHLTAIIDRIMEGSLIIVWLVLPDVAEKIIDNLKSRPSEYSHFFLKHEIVSVSVAAAVDDINNLYSTQQLLRETVTQGDWQRLKALLQQSRRLFDLNVPYQDGKSPLIIAAELGHDLVILTLLDAGADISFKQEPTGRTALFFAAENGHEDAVALLLAYGADPRQRDSVGVAALDVATTEKVLEEFEPYVTESAKRPILEPISTQQTIVDLIEATKSDDTETVEYILTHTKEDSAIRELIKARENDKHGWTALMYASDKGNARIAEQLLARGADPNESAKSNGWTCLMLASRRGSLQVTKMLLDRGADPNLANNEDVSALSIALHERRTAVPLLLIHRGADVHFPDQHGWTPLIRASNEGNLKLVKIIADLGANLNDQTNEGWSALTVASNYGHTGVVMELLDRGACINLATETSEHIKTDRSEEGQFTPKNSYTCEHCGKRLRTNERLFHKCHMDDASLRAINIPPIGSNLNVPDIFIPKNEDKKEEKENNEEDNSLQASGSDVDSLSSMTESSESKPPSPTPTTLSSSSSEPPSSVREEFGQQSYKVMIINNLAKGHTPDSHYTCFQCGKEYHNDQRSYFVCHCTDGGSE